MNRRVGMAILASIFAVMGAACSQGAGEGAAVGTGRIVAPVSKVTVGLDDQFPPMTFRDEKNEFTGFDVDMAREAAKRVGCDIEFKAIEWSSKEADLYNKSIDMIWSATTITKVRALGMRFSQPYMENQQIIVVRTGSPITAKEDLVGKTVAVQGGSTSLIAVEADPQVKTFKEVRPYESNLTALDDLGKGVVDAVILDEVVGRYYVARTPDTFDVVEKGDFGTDYFGVAMRRDDDQLAAAFDQALNEMKADGTSARLSQKWFGSDLVVH